MGLIMLLMAPVSGSLVGAYGPRPSLFVAGPALLVGTLSLFGLGPHTSYVHVLLSVMIVGLGLRFRERADHQHGDLRAPAVPGGGGGGLRLDQPTDR